MSHRPAAWLVLALLVPLQVQAIPALKEVLTGDSHTLGMGGTGLIADWDLAALRMERPAFLSDFERPEFRLRVDTESTIDLGGDQFYAGTRAADMSTVASFVQPLKLRGRPLVLAVEGRYDDGSLRFHDGNEGLLLDVQEHRTAVQIGAAWKPWDWLRVGASAGVGDQHSYAVEIASRIGPLELGFVRRTEPILLDASVPPGSIGSHERPEVDANIAQTRQVAAFTGALRTKWVNLFASWDGFNGDYQVDGTVQVFPWLALRGYVDAQHYTLSNWGETDGAPIIHMDTNIDLRRWSVGPDLRFGRHQFMLRYVNLMGSAIGSWQDNGAVTGQKFFNVGIDFDLYLRHIYRLDIDQWSTGWRWTGERWGFSAGAQKMTVQIPVGGAVYGSALTSNISGHDAVPSILGHAVAVTGGVSYHINKTVELSFSLAQVIPYSGAAHTPGASASPPPSSPPAKPDNTPWLTQVKQVLDKYGGGGRVVIAEIRKTF